MGTVDGEEQLQVLPWQQQDAPMHLLVQLLLSSMLGVQQVLSQR
jgi:hypothetical protein